MTQIVAGIEASDGGTKTTTPREVATDSLGRVRVVIDRILSGAGLALDATLSALSAKIPASLGPATPAGSLSTVAPQSAPVTWRVPVTTSPRALLIAWAKNTAYTVGEAVINDTGKVYVCRTAGTSQNTDNAGPTGTSADITDGSVHWSYVAASATAFKGSMVLRNLSTSAAPLSYAGASHLAAGGQELPAGQAEPVFSGDATAICVATASSTATATVVAYP